VVVLKGFDQPLENYYRGIFIESTNIYRFYELGQIIDEGNV
jgi:hypothetical protein